MATEAFVGANYATKADAANSGGVTGQSLGANGYIKYKNGLIMQWGYDTRWVSDRWHGTKGLYINFPIPFPKQCYTVIPTCRAGHWDSTIDYSWDRTRFHISTWNESGCNGTTWVAFGY